MIFKVFFRSSKNFDHLSLDGHHIHRLKMRNLYRSIFLDAWTSLYKFFIYSVDKNVQCFKEISLNKIFLFNSSRSCLFFQNICYHKHDFYEINWEEKEENTCRGFSLHILLRGWLHSCMRVHIWIFTAFFWIVYKLLWWFGLQFYVLWPPVYGSYVCLYKNIAFFYFSSSFEWIWKMSARDDFENVRNITLRHRASL